jgi:hypothetical protein
MTNNKNRRWTNDQIIKGLKAMSKDGVPMTYDEVGAIDNSLLQASVYHFGTLRKALVAADLPPPKGRIWDEKKVIKEIKQLHKTGVDLSASRVHYSHSGLYRAAVKYCGSWNGAMWMAGIAPEKYLRGLKGPKQFLTEEDVIDRLKALHLQGVEMSTKGVGAADRKLYYAVKKHFEHLGSALEKAGLQLALPPPRSTLTGEKVILEIKKLSASGEEMSCVFVKHHHPKLARAAFKQYGTWTNALTMSGIDPAAVRKRRRSTDQELLDELRRLHGEGKPVNAWALHQINSGLATTLLNRWGSHDAALRAAGLDPAKIRLK